MPVPNYDPTNDFYALLGLDEDFTPDQLRSAYRKLAKDLHPDTNPDPDAATKFKLVNWAYEILRDDQQRQEYDQSRLAYYLSLPPVLRLSTTTVDFGTAGTGDHLGRVVLLFNDGGEAICDLSAKSGRFWSVEPVPPNDDDPKDAIGKLIFRLEIDSHQAAGVQEEEIKVFLESDSEVSAKKLLLRVNVSVAATAPPPRVDLPPVVSVGGGFGSAVVPPTPRSAPGPLVALLLCVTYIGAPFLIMFLAVTGGHSSAQLHSAWQGVVSLGCFFWLISSFVAVPWIWNACTD